MTEASLLQNMQEMVVFNARWRAIYDEYEANKKELRYMREQAKEGNDKYYDLKERLRQARNEALEDSRTIKRL